MTFNKSSYICLWISVFDSYTKIMLKMVSHIKSNTVYIAAPLKYTLSVHSSGLNTTVN